MKSIIYQIYENSEAFKQGERSQAVWISNAASSIISALNGTCCREFEGLQHYCVFPFNLFKFIYGLSAMIIQGVRVAIDLRSYCCCSRWYWFWMIFCICILYKVLANVFFSSVWTSCTRTGGLPVYVITDFIKSGGLYLMTNSLWQKLFIHKPFQLYAASSIV